MKFAVERGLIIGALNVVDQEIPTESSESMQFISGRLGDKGTGQQG